MKPRSRLAMCVLTALGVAAPAADAQARDLYGLLRSRDLTPFGFLRLDMRPAHAVAIEPGSWAIETELGYQNTWALSPEVEDYLTALEPQGRRDLGPAEGAAIQALPGENYLLDVEFATLDVTFHYKFSPDWTGYCHRERSDVSRRLSRRYDRELSRHVRIQHFRPAGGTAQ